MAHAPVPGLRASAQFALDQPGDACGELFHLRQFGPSTITRASGSVPENRTSTRPASPKASFGRPYFLGHPGNSDSGLPGAHPHVHQPLRIDLQSAVSSSSPVPASATPRTPAGP